MDEHPEIMRVSDAAEFLQCTEEHVRRLARRAELPARKIGSEWRFSRRQLLAYIEAGENHD